MVEQGEGRGAEARREAEPAGARAEASRRCSARFAWRAAGEFEARGRPLPGRDQVEPDEVLVERRARRCGRSPRGWQQRRARYRVDPETELEARVLDLIHRLNGMRKEAEQAHRPDRGHPAGRPVRPARAARRLDQGRGARRLDRGKRRFRRAGDRRRPDYTPGTKRRPADQPQREFRRASERSGDDRRSRQGPPLGLAVCERQLAAKLDGEAGRPRPRART